MELVCSIPLQCNIKVTECSTDTTALSFFLSFFLHGLFLIQLTQQM
jgi:hypothetical protein